MTDVLSELGQVLELRKTADPACSYVATLYARGLDHILAKIVEEAGETVSAARTAPVTKVVSETADLWFHTLVLLAHLGMGPQAVIEELGRRLGIPGLVEKSGRIRSA
jgi:phosphoribosyl-ATP pyrophosphohydrolase